MTVLLNNIRTIDYSNYLNPSLFCGDDWNRFYRQPNGRMGSTKTENEEYWAGHQPVKLNFQLPNKPSDSVLISINIRAPWTEENEKVRLSVYVNNVEHPKILFGGDAAYSKVILVKKKALAREINLVLKPDTAWTNPSEFAADLSVDVSFEISAIIIYPSIDDFLKHVQLEYDHAHNARYELFDRGLDLLEDRGELIDKIQTTLSNIQRLKDDSMMKTQRALKAFLKDPHVLGQDQSRIVFNRDYFNSHRKELLNGIVLHDIRLWKERFDRFHELVVQNGNRAFMRLGDHKPGQPSESPKIRHYLKRLSQLKDGFSKKKLAYLKERNNYLNTLEILLKRDKLISVVPDLEIEMSSYCNYACVMCGRSWSSFLFVRQDDQQLERLLPVLPYIRHITIAGVGENTSSDRLEIFAKMTEAFQCDTRIFTNGSFIHKQLDALALFKKVCVSFDGGKSETFETQRRGANFDLVLKNIEKLRKKAPDITLAFSVVVSRLNIHELPLIAQLAVDLNVNHVAFSPVWHKSPMELRPSDKDVFYEKLAEAKKTIARSGSVVIQCNVTPEDFCVAEDAPLDVEELRDFINDIEFPSLRIPKAQELKNAVQQLRIAYHPNARIFPDRKWPDAPAPVLKVGTNKSEAKIKLFDLDAAIAATNEAISDAEMELVRLDYKGLEIPYCLSIWKYTYLRSNGKNRLCPQAFVDVGNNRRDGFRAVMNGPKNQKMRNSMFSDEKTDYCKTCLDPYRRWGHKEMVDQLLDMNLHIPDNSHYSVDHENRLDPSIEAIEI